MATLNYSKRLENLQSRKFSRELNESALSRSFDRYEIPDNVKYLIESMRGIDQKYNSRTLTAADRVQRHLEDGLQLHFARDYRTQGSVKTSTNIKVHSDFDLLTIISKYFYLHPELPSRSPYTGSDPKIDIQELREQATSIMKVTYDDVDTSGTKSISIRNKALNRKVDIVFAYWYNTEKYEKTMDEYYRGVQLYDFIASQRITDYPFAHIQNVNRKGDNTYDGSRRGIRLLKNLKADSDYTIDLSSFQLTTIVHVIDNAHIQYSPGSEWSIAKAISEEMNTLIENPTYRKHVKSPNGTETPFIDDGTVAEIIKLKADLDELIADTAKEVQTQVVSKAIRSY